MRVLVTGGAGFVGSHLCDRLLSEGHEVVAVDNLYTGRRENLAHLDDEERFSLVEHDICEPLPELGELDRIYNLACPASPPHYQRDPFLTLRTCFDGTMRVLELAERSSARFLQASTSEVYGDPEEHPQTERYRGNVNTLGPRACYDEGKRIAETLCADFERAGRCDVRIIRIFNTYGPRMDPRDGRVVSNFVTQALRGESLTVYGSGSQTRSFCYVDDMVDGVLRVMEEAQDSRPFNVGNPNEFTVSELAETVARLVGSECTVTYEDLPQDDPKVRRPDIGRARAELGFEPSVDLEAGLHRTIEYFRDLAEVS